MGRGNVAATKTAIAVGLVVILLFGVSLSLFLHHARSSVAQLYVSDLKVAEMLAASFDALCCSIIANTIGLALAYSLSGMSRTKEVGTIQTVSIWIFNIPLGIYLGFYTSLGFRGFIWVRGALCLGLL